MGYWLGSELPVHPERRGIYAWAVHLHYFVVPMYQELGQTARAECVRSIADVMEEYALERE